MELFLCPHISRAGLQIQFTGSKNRCITSTYKFGGYAHVKLVTPSLTAALFRQPQSLF